MSGLLSQGILSNRKLSGVKGGIPDSLEYYYYFGTEQKLWIEGYKTVGDQLNKLANALQIVIDTGNSAFVTATQVSLAGFKKLCFEAEATIGSASQLSLGIATAQMDVSSVATLAYVSNLGRGMYSLDISAYQGNYYIKMRGDGAAVNAKIYRVWGEKA